MTPSTRVQRSPAATPVLSEGAQRNNERSIGRVVEAHVIEAGAAVVKVAAGAAEQMVASVAPVLSVRPVAPEQSVVTSPVEIVIAFPVLPLNVKSRSSV